MFCENVPVKWFRMATTNMKGCRVILRKDIMHWTLNFYALLLIALLSKMVRCHNNMTPMSRSYSHTPNLGCRLVGGLTRSQRAVCMETPDAAALAFEGLRMAVKECQHQFRWHRWNCSSLVSKSSNPHASGIMKRGYKETSFMYALASAAVAHSIAKGCAQGRLLSCGCDPIAYRINTPEPVETNGHFRTEMRWKWGGCSHNLEYGLKFSEKFLDSRESANDLQSKINVHNNKAGRQALSSNMEVRCKCHGMSGSCQMKTCWRAAPDFRVVASAIKRQYRSAIQVDPTGLNRGDLAIRGKTRRGRSKSPAVNNLLFYEKSPSFCDANLRIDTSGTTGRVCRTGSVAGGCDVLCCGRGHDLVRRVRSKRCKCRFEWCCRVECQKCKDEKWIAVCK